jgi:nucleotide-binding universal stress UspA family protein
MSAKHKVFISHSEKDTEKVIELARKLDDSGINIWFDEWSLTPGADWQQTINNEIKESDYFLIFIGKKGLSKWSEAELNEAIKSKNKKIIVIRWIGLFQC